MVSLGKPPAFAFSTAVLKRKLPFKSPPPILAAMMISLENLAKFAPRAASAFAFLCLIFAHLECPDIF